eukprot:768703-Hanusia_phi.AAC.2
MRGGGGGVTDRRAEQRQESIGFVSFVSAMNVFNSDTRDEIKLQCECCKMGQGWFLEQRGPEVILHGYYWEEHVTTRDSHPTMRQRWGWQVVYHGVFDGEEPLRAEFSKNLTILPKMIDKDELHSRMTINF